jgi:hypothetical protein
MTNKILMAIMLLTVLVAGTFLGNAVAIHPSDCEGSNKGKPFLELWHAICELRADLDNIQLTPGPQGEQGPQGDTGPQGPAGVPCTDGCVDTASLADGAVINEKVALGALTLDRMQTSAVATGFVELVQPDHDVAAFNPVIAETGPLAVATGPAADTFEPFVIVSIRPTNPPTGTPYEGDVSWKLVSRYHPEIGSSPKEISYRLQFFLDTQPQPPGTPDDPAPPGSKVNVHYRVLFLKFQ